MNTTNPARQLFTGNVSKISLVQVLRSLSCFLVFPFFLVILFQFVKTSMIVSCMFLFVEMRWRDFVLCFLGRKTWIFPSPLISSFFLPEFLFFTPPAPSSQVIEYNVKLLVRDMLFGGK